MGVIITDGRDITKVSLAWLKNLAKYDAAIRRLQAEGKLPGVKLPPLPKMPAALAKYLR